MARFRDSGATRTQLAGNHEHQYVGGETFWAPFLDHHDAAILWEWRESGWMTLAAAVNGHPITHAGLTAGLWDHLGAPVTAEDAAASINEHRDDPAVTRPGWMLAGNPVDHAAGVNWAESTREVVASWEDHGTAPFPQVCGHTNPYRWTDGRLSDPTLPDRVGVHVDPSRRHTRIEVAGVDLWFIDPGFGRRSGTIHPFTLPAAAQH